MKQRRSEFTSALKKAERIVIKVGSARVSGDEHEINDFLFSLVGDIRELRDQGKDIILVSSGAIAQGRKVLSMYRNEKTGSSVREKQALAAIGQSLLMKMYSHFFSNVNIPIAQILFGSNDLSAESGYSNLKNTFEKLSEWKVLPIINENDSVATEELKLGDNDILSALVAILVKADLLVILTGVDGFQKDGKTVPFLEEITEEDLSFAKGPEGPGTGGMNTKLRAAGILLKAGISTAVISGKEKNCIRNFLNSNTGGTLVSGKMQKKSLSEKEIKKLFGLGGV